MWSKRFVGGIALTHCLPGEKRHDVVIGAWLRRGRECIPGATRRLLIGIKGLKACSRHNLVFSTETCRCPTTLSAPTYAYTDRISCSRSRCSLYLERRARGQLHWALLWVRKLAKSDAPKLFRIVRGYSSSYLELQSATYTYSKNRCTLI